jgi:hypothetical protein
MSLNAIARELAHKRETMDDDFKMHYKVADLKKALLEKRFGYVVGLYEKVSQMDDNDEVVITLRDNVITDCNKTG